MPNEVLTISEVAKLLRVSEDTIRKMIDDGEMQAFKVRGQWRIRKEEVERIMRGKQ